MDEQEKIKKTSQETEWELKPQYVIIALVVFVTFCCCILFFFMIYRYNGFTDFWKKLSLILQPIIIGVVIAYLLNPIMKFLEGHLLKFLEPRMKSKCKAKKTSRGIAITGSLVFLVGICVLLVAAIVPSISASIQSMITSFPQEAKDLTKWVDEVTNGDTELASMIQQGVDKITDTVETFFEDDIFFKGTDLSYIDHKRCDLWCQIRFKCDRRSDHFSLCDGRPGTFCRTGEKDRICDV